MASAEFGEDSEEKRPTVQVGDPFSEKLLLEACLEIMAKDCVIAIQDMGAAGLTCSAVEMGAKAISASTLDLDAVPCRETGNDRLRNDALGKPGAHAHGAQAREGGRGGSDLRKWGLDFAVVGTTTPTKRFVVRHGGRKMVDLPIKELGDEAPVYDRPHVPTPKAPLVKATDVSPPMSSLDALVKLLGTARPLRQALGVGAI